MSPRRQDQIIALVREYREATGEWPSDRYLARRLNLSRSTIRVYVFALAERGLVAGPFSPVRLTDRLTHNG